MSASTSKVIAFPDSMERQWGVFERELRAEYLATNSDLAELDHVLQQIKPLYIEQATPRAFVMNNPDEVLAAINEWVHGLVWGLLTALLACEIDLYRLKGSVPRHD